MHIFSGGNVLLPGSFGIAFSTAVCASTMCVAIFLWELGASSSSTSAFLYFTVVVATVYASVFFASSAFVSSSASTVVGTASSVIMTLVDLRLDISYGIH